MSTAETIRGRSPRRRSAGSTSRRRRSSPPIHPSTTFIRDPDNQYRSGRVYARDHNPTFDQAEAVLTALEKGHAALVFASGMAAATAVFQALAPGDHVLVPDVMYWSLRNWLRGFAREWGLARRRRRHRRASTWSAAAMRPGATKLVWIETPANPLWTITDIAGDVRDRACARARRSPSTRPRRLPC